VKNPEWWCQLVVEMVHESSYCTVDIAGKYYVQYLKNEFCKTL